MVFGGRGMDKGGGTGGTLLLDATWLLLQVDEDPLLARFGFSGNVGGGCGCDAAK